MNDQADKRRIWVTAEGKGERVDAFLASQLEWSRSRVQKLLAAGAVTLAGQVLKANYRLNEDECLQVLIPPVRELEVLPEDIPLHILYEDQDVIVINKPRGLVVHPAPGHAGGTLVNALLAHCRDLSGINGVLRPGIVHRLDKDTSGVMIAVKNDDAHHDLARQIKEHTARRTYLAIVTGRMKQEHGTISLPLGRHPVERKKFAVRAGGRLAVTDFIVKEYLPEYTVVECCLQTGRTHQIRVHMAHLGHPLLGDSVYGTGKHSFAISGQALHSAELAFRHPRTNENMRFAAPLPADMDAILCQLRRRQNTR